MVARGDLGVELGVYRCPFAQKLLISKAKKAGLFVINATQIVESMIEQPVPTRAEVQPLGIRREAETQMFEDHTEL